MCDHIFSTDTTRLSIIVFSLIQNSVLDKSSFSIHIFYNSWSCSRVWWWHGAGGSTSAGTPHHTGHRSTSDTVSCPPHRGTASCRVSALSDTLGNTCPQEARSSWSWVLSQSRVVRAHKSILNKGSKWNANHVPSDKLKYPANVFELCAFNVKIDR